MNNLTLITGASGGIGCGTAKYLLEQGHKNLLFQYNSNKADIERILTDFDLSPEKHLFQANLTIEDDVKRLRENILKNHNGYVSSLVNLAGASTNSMSWKMSTEEFKKIIDLNLLTTFLTCREFIPDMRENSYGRILNTSSVVGFTGVAGASHYCAAKAGITGYSKSIALELINKNITVNTLALGYINAGIISEVSDKLQEIIKGSIPSKRFGEVDEVGALVNYLISKEASYTTGQVHHINGGLY